jgi:hypothetical protein
VVGTQAGLLADLRTQRLAALSRPFDLATWQCTAYAHFKSEVGAKIGWDEYRGVSEEMLSVTRAKGQGVGVMPGITPNDRRRNEDYAEQGYVTALAIDIDQDLPDLAPISALLADLRKHGVTHHAQWRLSDTTHKVHVLIPYAEPFHVTDTDLVRQANMSLTRDLLPPGVVFDPAVCKAAGVLFYMHPRHDVPVGAIQGAWFEGPNAIDFARFAPTAVIPMGRRRKVSKEEATEQTGLFLKHVVVNEWLESKNAWDIVCPVGHEDDYDGKTYLYPSGHVSCMAGKCQGKPMAWFISHLDDEAQREAQSQSATALKVVLAQNTIPEKTVAEAHTDIAKALNDTRPVEGHATVVQVSTGAGKTHAAIEYLDVYAAPFEGERVGLSAVMAVPTNALLREVDVRLGVEHRVRTGVLAVLNDDGSPACKKHTAAKALQSSGGNVHRLLCSHCEYRDACPARERATDGDGSLTLTNHALMASTAAELLDAGRHPLLVWDESPQWVQTGHVLREDLDWLLGEFDREAIPIAPAGWLDALANVTLFSPRYRAAVRPVLELFRWSKSKPPGVLTARGLLAEWVRLPLHQMLLARALEASDLEPSGDAWADFTSAYIHAYRLNRVEMGFDTMRSDTQRRVLRAERLLADLGVMAGEDAVLVLDQHAISMASLTAAGALYRKAGGVVLDATANLAELRALRPDLSLVTCKVKDYGGSERYLVDTAGLDRKSVKHRTGRMADAIKHAKASTRRWGRANGCPTPKVALFTYKSEFSDVKVAWPEAEVAWFGNTRGYDRFYQEGFDVFVTVGDPIANLGALALQWRVLTGQLPDADPDAWHRYVTSSAEAELAQAHGRARDPQRKLGQGGRLHLHYGRRVPSGWDLESTQIDGLTFAEPDVG